MTIAVRRAINISVIHVVRYCYSSNNSQNCEKRIIVPTNLSCVRPPARIEQLGSPLYGLSWNLIH